MSADQRAGRALLLVVACAASSLAARAQAADSRYYVANTRPPDAFLAMRSVPSSSYGERIEAMPNGTLLDVVERRADGWWRVRDVATGREGWALAGSGARRWIVCCAAEPVEPAPAAGMTEGFKTPSSNIFCITFTDESGPGMRCDLRSLAAFPPRPADCDLEWGDAFQLPASGRAFRLCHGDTAANPALPTLGYGATWTWNGLDCLAETSGLTCRNPQGHGFRLSRAIQQVF